MLIKKHVLSDSDVLSESFLFRSSSSQITKKDKSLRTNARYKGFCPGISYEIPIMGEEKPDEELMGKRKSSPRLSTTFVMSISLLCPRLPFLYLHLIKKGNVCGISFSIR